MGGCYAKIPDRWHPDYVKTLPRMEGKLVAITGCTSGTGLVLAQTCRRLGASVLMLNRNSERAAAAQKAVEEVQGASGATVETISCDLQSFASVRATIGILVEKFDKTGINVLVNNAGAFNQPDKRTQDGFEVQMQTNHLSHFLLTSGLLPLLEKAADLNGEARIVNHSSVTRKKEASDGGKLEKKYLEKTEDLGGDLIPARFKRYQQSKWANYVFTRTLHDKLTAKASKVKCMVAHPGGAATALIKVPACLLGCAGLQSEADGSLGITRGACATDVNSGDMYGPLNDALKGPAGLIPVDEVSSAQKQLLWEASEAASGFSFDV